MFRRITSAIATVALIAFFVAACSSDSTTTTTTAAASSTTAANASGTITVTLADVDANTMLLTPTPTSAPAGEVTFEVTNSGDREHEFVVVQTDLALADLPFDAAADEVLEDEMTVVDEIGSIMPGETKTLTVTLESGGYALICNLEGHFRKGMRAAFTVN
ncbi:MAG: cupredoxin domain-containing protein [Acidimicrobiia bacterium]